MVQKPPKGGGSVPYLLHHSFATLFWDFRVFFAPAEAMVHKHWLLHRHPFTGGASKQKRPSWRTTKGYHLALHSPKRNARWLWSALPCSSRILKRTCLWHGRPAMLGCRSGRPSGGWHGIGRRVSWGWRGPSAATRPSIACLPILSRSLKAWDSRSPAPQPPPFTGGRARSPPPPPVPPPPP